MFMPHFKFLNFSHSLHTTTSPVIATAISTSRRHLDIFQGICRVFQNSNNFYI
uniref:Uncharacterized protein n=1 Tax=Octopus bimaculoides TaxID=37653 RepID=A0A0L8FVL1_OCTBM